MSKTQATYRAEFLQRPKFSLYEDSYANKFGTAFQTCLNRALAKLWATQGLSNPNYEKTIAAVTLPTGVTWSSTAKIYKLNSGTTPVLTTDLFRIKKLWITNSAGDITSSKSTYDTNDAEGSGIPNSTTAVALTDVYHELVGEGTDQELQIVIGTTAAGTTPQVIFTYTPNLVLLSGDSDVINVPETQFYSDFEPLVEAEAKQFLFGDGF